MGLSNTSAGKWRKHYAQEGIRGLTDAPRREPPRTISGEKVAEVLRLTLETKPAQGTHWSTFGLAPHRSESVQLRTDPHFVEKVRDVVGLYMSPPNNALVLSLDEKSQCQALERSQPILPMLPGGAPGGAPERASHDYFRHGTTTWFAAMNVKTGEVFAKCKPRPRQKEFLEFLRHIERVTPPSLAILDYIGTHNKDPKPFVWTATAERIFEKIKTFLAN
ncbi:MAG: hypothetical protein RIS79_3958 [Verrucomicrobiota bacterium]